MCRIFKACFFKVSHCFLKALFVQCTS
ncbi:hypothetical protein Nmel_007748, partial [Mimus melanotis]